MAEVRGRKCDRVGCSTFVTDAPNLPDGWIQFIPKTADNKGEGYELCSNYCAALLSIDRYEADTNNKFKRPYTISEEGRRKMRLNGAARAKENKELKNVS